MASVWRQKFASNRKESLQNFIDKTEKNQLSVLEEAIKSTTEKIQQNTTKFKSLVKEMKAQGEKCKDEINALVNEFVSNCNRLEKENRELLNNHKKNLEEQYTQMTETLKECREALQSGSEYKSGVNHTAFSVPEMPKLETVEVYPCQSITDHLKAALGQLATNLASDGVKGTSSDVSKAKSTQLQTKSSPQQLSHRPQSASAAKARRPQVTSSVISSKNSSSNPSSQDLLIDQPMIMSEFKSPCRISSICPTPEGQAWTRHATSITLLDRTGRIKFQTQCDDCVTDIGLCPTSRKLWFCTWGRSVMVLDPFRTLDPSPKEIFATDTIPWCICVTNTGRIVIGMKNKVTMYTAEGEVVHTTTTQESGVISPQRITQCPITGNIALVDSDKRNSLIMDETLQVKFHYIGEGMQAGMTTAAMKPVDLTYDSSGNLVIGDSDNRTLELISGAGQHIRTLHIDTGLIKAVGIEPGNVLWTAVYDRNGDLYRVKLLQYV